MAIGTEFHGYDISPFDSALKLQSYGGKCPDMTGSGDKSYPKGITKVRNSYLSNAAYESAVSLVVHRNEEFYNLFTGELEKEKQLCWWRRFHIRVQKY